LNKILMSLFISSITAQNTTLVAAVVYNLDYIDNLNKILMSLFISSITAQNTTLVAAVVYNLDYIDKLNDIDIHSCLGSSIKQRSELRYHRLVPTAPHDLTAPPTSE